MNRHMSTRSLTSSLLALFPFAATCLLLADGSPTPTPQFERDVLPVLTAKCASCHGAGTAVAGLDLRTAAGVQKGSEHGPVVVKGSAEKSVLYQKVFTQAMPPGKDGKLSREEVATIGRWIDAGAPGILPEPGRVEPAAHSAEAPSISDQDRKFWAFQKPACPQIPQVKQKARVRSPIDSFVLAKLEQKSLGFSQDADRRTLIRRASFDLTGLPPSPEQVEAFVADRSPEAYERLLDRLLASKHFGEQWGRHWLDAAGYVDNQGLDHLVEDYKMLD